MEVKMEVKMDKCYFFFYENDNDNENEDIERF